MQHSPGSISEVFARRRHSTTIVSLSFGGSLGFSGLVESTWLCPDFPFELGFLGFPLAFALALPAVDLLLGDCLGLGLARAFTAVRVFGCDVVLALSASCSCSWVSAASNSLDSLLFLILRVEESSKLLVLDLLQRRCAGVAGVEPGVVLAAFSRLRNCATSLMLCCISASVAGIVVRELTPARRAWLIIL